MSGPELTLASFAPRLGQAYEVTAGGQTLRLVLAEAQELPSSGRAGGSFRLEFRGPLQPILPQAIYRFTSGRERHDIFIVPIGAAPDAVRYEAIFF